MVGKGREGRRDKGKGREEYGIRDEGNGGRRRQEVGVGVGVGVRLGVGG